MEYLYGGNRVFKYSVLKLIKLIKCRPIIWDSSRADFRAYSNKQSAWKDIYEALDDKYRTSNERTQAEIGMKITAKWRNIRDAFLRSFKKRATHTKVKKYMYHDQLSFMLGLLTTEPTAKTTTCRQSTNSESASEHLSERSTSFDDGNLNDPLVTVIKVEPADEPSDCNDSLKVVDKEEIENEQNVETTLKRKAVNVVDENETSCSKVQRIEMVTEDQPIKREKRTPSFAESETSENKTRDLTKVQFPTADEDQSFFDSILSLVRDMNDDEKLEFRMAVLQQIHKTRARRRRV